MEKTFEGLQAACAELDEAFCKFAGVMEQTDDMEAQAEAYVTFVEAMDSLREKAGIDGHWEDTPNFGLKWIRTILQR